MVIERLQSHEEQDLQLEQTHRDASPNKNRGVRDFWKHQCQLRDLQQQEIQQRREGKEPAPAEEKDLLNGVAIGEDGKLVLSDCYDKDNPGLAGGVVEPVLTPLLLKAAAEWAIKGVLDWVKGKVWKKESVEQNMLGILIGRDFKIGLAYLDDARDAPNDTMQNKWIEKAHEKFMEASYTETGSAQQAKSMFCTAVCYHLLGAHDLAIKWFEKTQEKGDGLNKDEVKEIEVFLKKLQTPYSSDSTVNQFKRLERGSSSFISDRVTIDSETRKKEIKRFYDSGEKHRLAGRYKEALKDYDQVIALDRNHAFALSSRGATKRMLGDYQGSLRDLNDSLAKAPNNAWALRNRGEIKRVLGDYQGSLRDLNDSLAKTPNDAFALSSRGETKLRLGDYPGALKDLDKSLAKTPKSDWSHYIRAQYYSLTGRVQASAQDILAAVRYAQEELSTSSVITERYRLRFNIALYHLFQGEHAKAKSEYRELLSTCTSLGPLQGAKEDIRDLLVIQPHQKLALRLKSLLQTRIDELMSEE